MHLKNGEIEIKGLTGGQVKELYDISFGSKADLEWMKWNGPYFNDPISNWDEFEHGSRKRINDDNFGLIYCDEKLVGTVSAYWEDGNLRKWLEFGLVIYNQDDWSKGIGRASLTLWIEYLFDLYPELERLGFTTWSGNKGMIRLGQKLSMTQEAKIRKVRFYQKKYYDSIKFGILRSEWGYLNSSKDIELVEVDNSNIDDILELTVKEEQKNFVADVPRSLAYVYANREEARAYGIYLGKELIGYASISYNAERMMYTIWHFFIDSNFQGKGYGKRALQELISYIKVLSVNLTNKMCLTVEEENILAIGLYESLGFVNTYERDEEDEFIMIYEWE
ncbi:GNAT family N-acetyltransferase [Floricoccus penangensis]|uniref:GNAT family N-acetyltransferase n=1 Tax=Floricoccus penangensis TaxID=1859475 RepID=UPI00218892FA|nr:GNAT family N-acetyltransferase [Floricoccus penangensis]